MSVRIIAGKFKGRELKTPLQKNDKSPVRPTKNIVREAMFTTLGSRLEFSKTELMLDLFCGSGATGIEALSRGVKKCIFVDIDPSYCQQNIQTVQADKSSFAIKTSDAGNFKLAENEAKAELIIADPPYGTDLLNKSLQNADFLGQKGCLWLIECAKNEKISIDADKFDVLKEKSYGKSKITLLQQKK